MNRAELLAPAGNMDCVRAAVSAGADAVYLGGQLFNARAYANNFSNEELARVCDYCHSYGVKVYVTVNTLYRNDEFEPLGQFIDALYVMGVDGLIMQDLGAIALVRKNWPDLPVHVSTQLTTNGSNDIAFYEKMGISTVVLSRELSIEEIRKIVSSTSMKIEAFIHGALCVSYSGQCLMSSVINGRSGNRGKCAQNCRMYYDLVDDEGIKASGHLLSTKDICTVRILPELLATGVSSLKIEGRMKSPEYVAGVTSIYRKYIDMYYSGTKYKVDEDDVRTLLQLFNRGYFSEGYLQTHSGAQMMCPVHPKSWGVRIGEVIEAGKGEVKLKMNCDLENGDGIEIWTPDGEGAGCYINKPYKAGNVVSFRLTGSIKKGSPVYQTYDRSLMNQLSRVIESCRRSSRITGKVEIRHCEPARLTFEYGGIVAEITGKVPSDALNQPLNEEIVKNQLSRLGNTVFELEDLQIILDDGLYLNRADLNDLRNQAAEKLENMIIDSYHRISRIAYLQENKPEETWGNRELTVSVSNIDQFTVAVNTPEVRIIYLNDERQLLEKCQELTEMAHKFGRKIMYVMPRIWRDEVAESFNTGYHRLQEAGIDGYLVSAPGHLEYLKDSGKEIRTDYTANVINTAAVEFWLNHGVSAVCLSPEIGYQQLKITGHHDRLEVVGYGQIPLMITHQCPIGNYLGNKKDHRYCRLRNSHGQFWLKDRNFRYLLKTDCDRCLCTIYSDKPAFMPEVFTDSDCQYLRVCLVNETAAQARDVLDAVSRGKKPTGGYLKDLYEEQLQ